MVLASWLVLISGYQLYAWSNGLSPLEAARNLVGVVEMGPTVTALGALIYVSLWIARPLVLFPAGLLAVAAGFAFGPIVGVALTLVGGNASASVSYLLGRYFGAGVFGVGTSHRLDRARRYLKRLRGSGFETILAMQLVYVPFDLVNCTAGFFCVRWRQFALATLLGTLPGTVSFVLLGASLEMRSIHTLALDPRLLLTAVSIFLISVLASRYLRRREGGRKGEES